MNSLKQTLLLSGAVIFIIIGIHQSMVYGIGASYWLIMLATACLMLFRYGKKKEDEKAKESQAVVKGKPVAGKKLKK